MVRMDLFRSEEMNKVQLIIPVEAAHNTVTYLAELGLIQLIDVRLYLLPDFVFHEFSLISTIEIPGLHVFGLWWPMSGLDLIFNIDI